MQCLSWGLQHECSISSSFGQEGFGNLGSTPLLSSMAAPGMKEEFNQVPSPLQKKDTTWHKAVLVAG